MSALYPLRGDSAIAVWKLNCYLRLRAGKGTSLILADWTRIISDGRVALGGCPPRAPTDPYVGTLDHTVPQATPSLRHDLAPRRTRQLLSVGVSVTPRKSSMPPRCFPPTAWLLGASLPIPRVLAGRVPRIPRYYQGTATSCRPSRRTSLPSFGGTTGSHGTFRLSRRHPARNGGPGVGHPVSPSGSFFRGDDRSSQVPGEPQFPFAHDLRPRPADASLTLAERSHGPR